MTKKPSLFYFNDGKGRAELIRLIFVCGKIPFNDQRVSVSEYISMRDQGKLPFEQFPILIVGDQSISQSCAIARYAARMSGLYPSGDIEAALSDMVVDAWRDLLDLFYDCYVDRVTKEGKLVMTMRSEGEKVEKLNRFFKIIFPVHLNTFEQMISNNSNSSFLITNSITWADLAIFDLLDTLDPYASHWTDESTLYYVKEPFGPFEPPQDLFKDYPQLEALKKIISEIPQISAWLLREKSN
ncbi:MAG: glutathione S-transferase family protein [Crocosphaera sp.]|nr:glutathione S-transferase family protein [Crocosphaera sp.]